MVQWISSFYFYSVIGWIWETCYVSARKRKWVNRGFLKGPWLPIYGFGALLILLCTAPVKDSLILIFLAGMISASALEYCTGSLMEKLFHVRWWDYSNQPCNLNGHICLNVSLAWGAASVFLVKGVHPQTVILLEKWMHYLPTIAAVLTILFFGDVVISVQEALHLKHLLARLSEKRNILHAIEAKMEMIASQIQWNPDLLKEKKAQFEKLRDLKVDIKPPHFSYHQHEQNYLSFLEKQNRQFQQRISALKNDFALEQESIKSALDSIQHQLHQMRSFSVDEHAKEYHKALSILHRNPDSISKKYQDALKELSSYKDSK